MSLISDALKTKQREATARSAKDSQPLIDGFFPYVSSGTKRSRSRLMPVVVVSVVGAAILAVTAFLIFSKPEKVAPTAARAPIVLPPPVAVGRTPVVDTAAVSANSLAEASGPVEKTSAPATSELPQIDRRAGASSAGSAGDTRSDRPSTVREIASAPGLTDAPISSNASIPRVPAARSEVPTAPRIDYEAQATIAFNAGDLAGAREKFLLATRYAPTARAWTNYGVTLQRLGEHTGAAAAYQSAIGIDPNYLEAWLYQGRLASDLGDVNRAIPLFERARAINPRNAEVNIELARLAYDAKNWTHARRFAEEAMRSEPSNARANWYFAVASDQLKDADAAVRGYSAYLQAVSGAEREQERFVGWARERIAVLRGKP